MGELSNIAWWEKTKNLGSKPGLLSIETLLRLLGTPQNDFNSVHVTGTNGKGSTSAMTASILQESGYRVGLFTSPHLSSWTESININGEVISVDEMEDVLGSIRSKMDELESLGIRSPTSFEVLVAACFLHFRKKIVDYAVIEVGMGGRNDATNVIPSRVSVLTNVSLEHTTWLGETVDEIARVKAGILRNNTAIVTAATQSDVLCVLEIIAAEKNSLLMRVGRDYIPIPTRIDLNGQNFHLVTPIYDFENLRLPLLGTHQTYNAACAVAAVQFLDDPNINHKTIIEGLKKVQWPGRFEIIAMKPLVILDGAKDALAAKRLKETVKTYLPELDIFTVISTSSDKDIESIVKSLAEVTGRFIITEHRIKSRTASAKQIEEAIKKTGIPYDIVIPVHCAIDSAIEMALKDDAILITGSIFLVGEAREYWKPSLQ